jgi:hypothetical protein
MWGGKVRTPPGALARPAGVNYLTFALHASVLGLLSSELYDRIRSLKTKKEENREEVMFSAHGKLIAGAVLLW